MDKTLMFLYPLISILGFGLHKKGSMNKERLQRGRELGSTNERKMD